MIGDGRRVEVARSGLLYAYVIVDPRSGPWRSEFKYRSEAAAMMVGLADLEWLREGEKADDEH